MDRIVFGVAELIPFKQISTSPSERPYGAVGQRVAPLRRKARAFAKRRSALDTQAQLFNRHYNLRLKYDALKAKAPAQAPGFIDQCRILRELLT
jgi:hypothetical protein